MNARCAAARTGVAFFNCIERPDDYDLARPWPVRGQVHGGVARQDREEGPRGDA